MISQKMDFLRKLSRVVFVLLIMQLALGTSFSFQNSDEAQSSTKVNWDQRVENLLVTEKGDIVITAVGDMIFNQEITGYKEPDYRNLLRIMQDAHIAYGNLEMSLNEKPESQRGTYQFGRGRDFGWEIAKTGINLVSLGNNHQFDYGPEGLKDAMSILRKSGISFAGAGSNITQARSARTREIYRTRIALVSFYSAGWRGGSSAGGPVISTLSAPKVMLEKEDGTTEEMAAPLASDVRAMEDAVVLAKRHADIVMVHFHFHWVPHSRAYPMPNKVPPHEMAVIHKAIDAGADIILGNGPHVLRGIEIYKDKLILLSQGNFIYQWKTPNKIPAIVFSRDQESMSGYEDTDRSQRGLDPRQESETYMARFTIRDKKFHKLEIIPVTLNVTGPRMGSPRLANDKRGKEIIEYMQELSAPYNTKITYKDWYGVVELKPTEGTGKDSKN